MRGNFMTLTRAHHTTAFSCHCCSTFTNDAKLPTYGNKHIDRQSRQWSASFCPVLPIGATVLPEKITLSAGGGGSVRVWRLADGTPLAHPLDLPELSWVVALRGNIIVTAAAGTLACTSQGLHDPYEIAPVLSGPADRHDHRIMAGYPVHRPVRTLGADIGCYGERTSSRAQQPDIRRLPTMRYLSVAKVAAAKWPVRSSVAHLSVGHVRADVFSRDTRTSGPRYGSRISGRDLRRRRWGLLWLGWRSRLAMMFV